MKKYICILALLCASTSVQAQNSWYLHADCANWNTLTNWYSAPVGGTNPTALNSADTYYCNGYAMRSPEAATGATFPGTLVLNGRYGVLGGELASSSLLIKLKTTTVPTSIAGFVTNGGGTRIITNSVGGTQTLNITNLTLTEHELTTFSTGLNTGLILGVGSLQGGGDCNLAGDGNVTLNVTNAQQYFGTMFVTGATVATIGGNFTSSGGLIVASGGQVRLNGNITVSSLRVNAVTNATDSFFGYRSSGTALAANTTYTFAELNAAYPTVFPTGSGSITVTQPQLEADAAQTVRQVSPYQFGANLSGTVFWMSQTPDIVADMKKAKVSMLRVGGYPKHGGASESLEDLDLRVAQTLNVGAVPQFIQMIDTAAHSPSFAAALMDLNGNAGTGGTVATNMAFLVRRYMAPPYNLTTQYWEVGNEPDIGVDYQVSSPAEYVAFYQSIHDQLVASGVRQNVKLCGPTVAFEYGFAANGNRSDNITRALISACALPRNGFQQLDVLTRHCYPELYNWETDAPDPAVTPYNYLNHPTEMVTFTQTAAHKVYRGEYALQTLLNCHSYPTSVGTGLTEYQVSSAFRHTITQGLWFLVYDHFSLYNPRHVMGAGFLFPDPSHSMSYYTSAKIPSYSWWATYVHGNLTGKEVLAKKSSDPHLLLTASKDASYVYLQVLNRNTTDIGARVNLKNAPVTGSPTLFVLDSTTKPDAAIATTVGTNFTYTFPAMSSRIFRYRRSDAPVVQPPLPPPSTVLLDEAFDATPTGMQVFTDATFVPTVTAGALRLTSNTAANTATAAILNGRPLPAAANRAQARVNFRIDNGHAGTGFTFAAYSASPNGVGAPAGGLGYFGQPNRLFAIKLQNKGAEPDQIGIVPTTCNSTVDGWAGRAIPSYYLMDLFLLVDYEGTEGTVRARLYQGTSEAGTLFVDITNKVGNVSALPAGTVFGFTGATQAWTETTLIQRIQVLTGNTGAPVNLVANPGFEAEAATQTPSGWAEWKTPDASYTETAGGAHGGALHGTHTSTAASYEVSTYQIKTGLTPGIYTLKAWTKSSGGQTAQLYAKGFDAAVPGNKSAVSIPASTGWTQLVVPNINVTSGSCEVGFWSRTSTAARWIYFDDVEFVKE